MISIKSSSSIQNFNMIKEILGTHSELTSDDKKYALTYISEIIEENKIDNDILSRFLLYCNKNTYVGLFAYCYNDFFDSAIKSKNEKVIKNMVLETKENVFFELFDNKLITSEDKKIVSSILGHELQTIKNTLKNIGTDISVPIFIGQNSLYQKEYQKLILDETGVHSSPIFLKNIYVVDKFGKSKFIFTFDLLDLLLLISKNNNLNTKTMEQFSPEVYQELKNKYSIEVKLILRYLKSKK
jgi:hypothetical protein